jgi:hypothetical protein
MEGGVKALLIQSRLDWMRTLIGDPAGIHGRHQDAVGLEHLLRAGAGQHVQRGLGHVGVRVPGAFVPAAELALHR